MIVKKYEPKFDVHQIKNSAEGITALKEFCGDALSNITVTTDIKENKDSVNAQVYNREGKITRAFEGDYLLKEIGRDTNTVIIIDEANFAIEFEEVKA